MIGADVPSPLGAEIKPMHGGIDQGGHVHTEIVYRVSGRMAVTGTAWDRAILVPIRAVWQLHGMEGDADHDHAGEAPDGAAAGDHDHGHEAHIDADAALDEHFDADTPGIPAVLVKPKTVADAYRLRQEYRGETTLAVFPAEVLTRLYATLGDARSLLLAIAIGTQVIVVAAILLVTIMHVGARQRQIGALRAFGASRGSIVAIVWGELFLLFLAVSRSASSRLCRGAVPLRIARRHDRGAHAGGIRPRGCVPGGLVRGARGAGVDRAGALRPSPESGKGAEGLIQAAHPRGGARYEADLHGEAGDRRASQCRDG